MSLTSTETTGSDRADDPAYYEGRADAYDDSKTRTVTEMVVLASMAIDFASLPYALGYFDRVTELRMEDDMVTAAETELAHADHRKPVSR